MEPVAIIADVVSRVGERNGVDLDCLKPCACRLQLATGRELPFCSLVDVRELLEHGQFVRYALLLAGHCRDCVNALLVRLLL